MKRKVIYIITMVYLVLSAALIWLLPWATPIMGISCFAVFGGSSGGALMYIWWYIYLAAFLVLVSLCYFKGRAYRYPTLILCISLFILDILSVLLVTPFPAVFAALLTAAVIYITRNEKEEAEEKTSRRLLKGFGTAFGSLVLVLLMFVTAIFNSEQELKIIQAEFLETMPTEKVSDEIAEKIDTEKYDWLDYGWECDGKPLKLITEKPFANDSTAYWTVDENGDFLWEVYHGKQTPRQTILVREDFKYPNVKSAPLEDIKIHKKSLKLSSEDMDSLRDIAFALPYIYDDSDIRFAETVNPEKAGFEYDERGFLKKWNLEWFFSGSDLIYKSKYSIIKNQNGELYIADETSVSGEYCIAKIPDEISAKIHNL